MKNFFCHKQASSLVEKAAWLSDMDGIIISLMYDSMKPASAGLIFVLKLCLMISSFQIFSDRSLL